ncbi:MAG TPA: methionine adenosyltransferase [Clostridiales bacterium]|nr:MAG: methionine adenosyltransferase [Clostridiales bacterium GWD2_32_59]HAN10281.1 methionine adenosyltransferase [Clostridiales bacterium]
MSTYLFTSESVTEGHPDKICDQIADAILDGYITKDPNARVACEVAVTTDLVIIMGEISANCEIDLEKVIRDTIRKIGYDKDEYKFNADTCEIIIRLDKQSPDIAMGVDDAVETKESIEKEIGAGDQGMMFGYACDETEEYMPLAITIAHKIAKRLSDTRKQGIIKYLRPDGKAQVTVEYENDIPKRIDTIVVSAQHEPNISIERIRSDIIKEVVNYAVPKNMIDINTKYLINPTGCFVIGGPAGDTGLTGRKIIVDTYGGYARHGGGAFSGKDPTKVDRSAAYMARHVAKSIVASGYAKRCEVQIAYAIGKANPVSIYVDTFLTGKISNEELIKKIKNTFDLKPRSIIDKLNLKTPIYSKTSVYGHFGKIDESLTWEKVEKI